MKDIIIAILATLPIVFFEIFASFVYSAFVVSVLAKDAKWKYFLMLWVGLLLFQAGIYTWFPGKMGIVVSYFDGLIKFVDRELLTNLSLVMFLHAGGIGLATLNHLWKSIRKKVKFSGKYVLLELAMTVVLIFFGVRIGKNVNEATKMADSGKISAIITIGVILIIWGYSSSGLRDAFSAMKANTKKSENS